MRVNPDHRGHTVGGRYVWRPLLQPEPDDFPPDSKYWLLAARKELSALQELDKAWESWYNNTIPDYATCKDIALTLRDRIKEINSQ